MTIYVLGNPLVECDAIGVQLIPRLHDTFPQHTIIPTDPTENFIPDEGSVIIDAISGISKVTVFDSLDAFAGHSMVSPHDYDLYFHLQLLLKLKKIREIRIIGIPVDFGIEEAVKQIQPLLIPTESSENAMHNSCTDHTHG